MKRGIPHVCDLPKLMQEWDYTKNESLGLDPTKLSMWSHKTAWWKCENGHEWPAIISHRSRGRNCPYCYGRYAIEGKDDLQTVNPELAKQWNYNKNGSLSPKNVKAQSNKRVWWICENGHEWSAPINRRSNGNGCPICSGRVALAGYNDLATLRPDIAKQWHKTKNGELKPQDVTIASHKKVWWQCDQGHEWIVTVKDRKSGKGCPFCSGRYAIKGENDLATTDPELAKEWNYDKNGDLKPEDVKSGSHNKVWWICERGHEWPAYISSRATGIGCPICASEKQSSFPEQALYFYLSKRFNAESRIKKFGCEIDIYLPFYKIGIEYDGLYFHNSERSQKSENKKDKKLKDNGISIIRIKESDTQNKTIDNIIYYVPDYNYLNLAKVLKNLFCLIDDIIGNNTSNNIDTDIARDRIDIINSYKQLETENSLAVRHPEIAAEWNYEKNGSLKPTMFFSGSGHRVWWKCKKGHEWQAPILQRTGGSGCPYCSGRVAIEGENDLVTLRPELAKEWNYEKNGTLTPNDVKVKSNTKVWWRCRKGHEWNAAISNRAMGRGCPFCSGNKVLSGYNDLATKRPDIAKQWNYDKNGALSPSDFLSNSNKQVWWVCEKGHEWQAKINNRVNGTGCPICAGKKVLAGYNDLATKRPDIAEQWHPTKNGDRTAQDFTAGSEKKVWWLCPRCGYEWEAQINNRTSTKYALCPMCRKTNLRNKEKD
ncbi:MAG: zinc-ribbon domain-containing protein [Ruminococcus sp.]|nr:zinc-ribbon domain-containing protein [Ruminococcus sp.]